MVYNLQPFIMRKTLFFLISLMITSVAFADETASCKFEGIPGAYVTAEVGNTVTGDGDVTIKVYSYGVSEASVQVVLKYTTDPAGEKVQEQKKLISISNGSGSGKINVGKSGVFKAKSLKVYNAVCNDKKE